VVFSRQNQQKLQNLLFPEGIVFNRQKKCYLTPKVNAVFSIFTKISGVYKNRDTKKEPLFSDSSHLVEQTIQLSNQFIDDYKKIIEFSKIIDLT
jgi:hypothetical protein